MNITDIAGSWVELIYGYIKDGTLPADKQQARKLRIRSARYVLIDDILFRRSFSQPLLQCLTPTEADYVIREIHEGVCGNHVGTRALAHRAITLGYYWPTMRRDDLALVKKYDRC